MERIELAIIGGGPAGLTAALYAARYKLKTVIFTQDIGGLAATAHKICNFPSYDEITGFELTQLMHKQVEKLKVPMRYEQVKTVKKDYAGFKLLTENTEYKAQIVIYAAGTKHRKLNVPGEKELLGRGVSYCATCDAAFFSEKSVAVIGGSDAALTASLLLADYASEVIVIYRGNHFSKGEPMWVELVENHPKIQRIFNEEVTHIDGTEKVTGIHLSSGRDISVDGIFIEIGSIPNLGPVQELDLELRNGYIVVDRDQNTSVPGVFAAGDITDGRLKQVITASSQGAIAAYAAYSQIKKGGR